ncbi:toll-like receptor 21 [Scleropages formosus]|uniref:Toll-like receptor 21 n=1 Tax=Scleropages formosus TaxID=113540 RepID=A0A8C9SJE6_SCLFO|nr:toll-like receptor 13 [Scleropages formosus]
MARAKSIALALVVVLCQLILLTAGYAFRNCIEDPVQRKTFSCIYRRQSNISALVGDLPFWAETLNLSNNYLHTLPPHSFPHLHQLRILRIDHNHLQIINAFAFYNLGQLETLNLSSNEINHLPSSAFSGLLNLTELILSRNVLETLSLDIFSGLPILNFLSLQGNHLDNFSQIAASVAHLHRLNKLDLSSNYLQSLQHSSSLPQSLTILYLCKNWLVKLACEPNLLSSVKLLDLSYNKKLQSAALQGLNLKNITYVRLRYTRVSPDNLLSLTNVNPGHIDFSGMSLSNKFKLEELCKLLKSRKKKLHKLILQSNEIQNLENVTFSNCPIITGAVDLSHNRLKSTDCLYFLKGQNYLTDIIVEHNVLTSLMSCQKLNFSFPKLTRLSYRYNRILYIRPFAFKQTVRIQTLNLNINNIAYMDHKALRGLNHLTTLRLDNNLLTDIYEDSFEDLYNLQILNLRNNRISVIFSKTFHNLNHLRILDLGGNKISQFQHWAFFGLNNLTNLYLDHNHLKEIESRHFGPLQATLQVLDLQQNLIRYLPNSTRSPFQNLTKLKDLKLGGQIPSGMKLLPHGFFHGLNSLKSLYFTNNQISSFQTDAFDDLTSLEFLSLDNSGIGMVQLHPGTLKNLRKLKRLSAENMGIESVSADVFGNLTELQVLQLPHNAIRTVDQALLNHLPNLRYLDLHECPISCTCSNTWLQNWTKINYNVQIVYLYNLDCPDLPGSKFYNFDIEVCYLDLGLYLFVSTSAIIFIFSVLPLLYVKLYWNLKYSYYVFRSWFGERWRKLHDEEEQCKYDAFISYNSVDEQWVLDQLVPNLEGKETSLRLCLHHRDFEPGRDIVDNIVNAVYGSRKTLCIVSQHYLRSEWCSLEIQLASYRLFHELRDVLLLVFLEPIPESQLSAYHRMRKVMLKKTYLQWPGPDCSDPTRAQELFWNQLRRALGSSNSSPHREDEKGEWSKENNFANQQVKDDTLYYLMP